MKKFLSNIILCLYMALIFSCSKDAEALTGNINGFVSDYTNANAAIAGATVTLGSLGRTKTTGSDGRYEFMDLEPGTYSISVTANEYQATTKQVTVYAGQTATCDFQLEESVVNVEINPVTLIFGSGINQLSFSIENKSNKSLTYSISNVPDYLEVSPASGTVNTKGTQTVSIKVINRESVSTSRNGQLIINIGSDSYSISFNIEPAQLKSVNVDIYPLVLAFDDNTEQMTFAITNNNTYAWDYSITNNLDIISVTPSSGTVAAGAKNTVTVTVSNRKDIDANRSGQLTINVGDNTFAVLVNIPKYGDNSGNNNGNDNNNGSESDFGTNISRGLRAFYSFDNENADDKTGNFNGSMNGGSFISSTPNGKGKALSLKRNEWVSIAENPIYNKTAYSINLWVKDYGYGVLFRTLFEQNNTSSSPTIRINNAGQLEYDCSQFHFVDFNDNLASNVNQWTMITVVTSEDNSTLFVNGKRVNTVHEEFSKSYGSTMTIGGIDFDNVWAEAMKVDNVRLYGVALSDAEIVQIYNEESGQ